jgi:hypothetical protein
MAQKAAKSAAELESMIMAELREHPECEKRRDCNHWPHGRSLGRRLSRY